MLGGTPLWSSSDSDSPAPPRLRGGASSLLKAVEACEKKLVDADAQRRRQVETPGGVDGQFNWNKFMKLAKHLQGTERQALSAASQAPVPKAV